MDALLRLLFSTVKHKIPSRRLMLPPLVWVRSSGAIIFGLAAVLLLGVQGAESFTPFPTTIATKAWRGDSQRFYFPSPPRHKNIGNTAPLQRTSNAVDGVALFLLDTHSSSSSTKMSKRDHQHLLLFPERDDSVTEEAERPPTNVSQTLLDRRWDRNFQRVLSYRETHGDVQVPGSWNSDGRSPNLGIWVKKQRQLRVKGQLREHRMRRLDDIGFVWHLGEANNAERWEDTMNALKEFRAEHGHTDVPVSYRRPGEAKATLSLWLRKQRESRSRLTKERKQQLEECGFALVGDSRISSADRIWDGTMQRLLNYRRIYGNLNVPIAWNGDSRSPQLGQWIHRQRRAHHNGLLRADRTERLDEIGFVWKLRENTGDGYKDEAWEMSYEQLLQRKLQGVYLDDWDSPGQSSGKLGRWVYTQRNLKRQGLLRVDREEKLAAVGFRWDVRKEMFDRAWIAQFESFQAALEDPKATFSVSSHDWAYFQRLRNENGTLEDWRKARLDEIGFTWDPHLRT